MAILEIRRAVAPIHIVTDFNNHLSPVECEQKIRAKYAQEGVLYEPPHTVNDITPFNITDGAFKIYQLVNNQLNEGRAGIFVGVVDPGVGSVRRGIVVTTEEGYTFVGPDNGIFSPTLASLKIAEAYKIDEKAFASSSVTFHGRDQFTPIAAEIAVGKNPNQLPQLVRIKPEELVKRGFADGQVVEADGYGNLKLWHRGIEIREGKTAKGLIVQKPVLFRGRQVWLQSINVPVAKTFEEVRVGQWLVYEGSSCITAESKGLIELAIREGAGKNSAQARLGAGIGDVLRLTWRF